jgi:Bifunctional DNA primase/polymerase, N-terminal
VTAPGVSAQLTMRDHATSAACHGWAVFPCLPDDKRPAVPRWEQVACADSVRVERYWPSPRHNVGIACGPSRLVVIDLDTHGQLPEDWRQPGITDGRDVFAQLAEWAGQTSWPITYTVATPSGGWHLYFAAPDNSKIRNSASLLGPMVDVRAQGGYVVGAGSVIDSRPYVALDQSTAAPLPTWLHRLLAKEPDRMPGAPAARAATDPGRRLRGLIDTVRDSKPGDRTGPLVWAAHRLAEMIADGEAADADAEQLVRAAVAAGIRGGEAYARSQVQHVLGGAR